LRFKRAGMVFLKPYMFANLLSDRLIRPGRECRLSHFICQCERAWSALNVGKAF
jgi:hypothetical protein